jgi:hypothetical protein
MPTFISHSFKDEAVYSAVCLALDAARIDRWNPAKLSAGLSLADQLRKAIEVCTACIFIATRRSIESPWCLAEIGAFWGAGKRVILFLADPDLTDSVLPPQFKGNFMANTAIDMISAAGEAEKKTESYGIHISAPDGVSPVDVLDVHGAYEIIPPGFDLRTLRYYPLQNGFIPHGSVAIDRATKTWRVNRFDVGGESGEDRGIVIALAGPGARILLDYWLQAHTAHAQVQEALHTATGTHGSWLPPITDWPDDLITCHRVLVKRK